MRNGRIEKALRQIHIKGKSYQLPAKVSGREVREAMQLPSDRMLTLRPASGGMVQQVRDRDVVDLADSDGFDDLPVGRWG